MFYIPISGESIHIFPCSKHTTIEQLMHAPIPLSSPVSWEPGCLSTYLNLFDSPDI